MLGNIFKAMAESSRLENLRLEVKPAILRGEKKCVRCGYCCMARTCIPTPAELGKIAEFLGLSMKDTILRYYAIDRDTGGGVYFVKPLGINILDLSGKFIPSGRTFNEGDCIFLEKNNDGITVCKIWSVRPESAKASECWDKTKEDEFFDKKLSEIKAEWDGKIERILGVSGKELENEEDNSND